MTQLIDHLTENFALKKRDSQIMAGQFEMQKLKRNEVWMKPRQHQSCLGVMKEGYLRIFSLNENGKEVTQWVCSPGELVCDLRNLLFDEPTRWHISALGPAQVACLSKSDYRALPSALPAWPELERQFLGRCFITLEERSHALLGLSAEARYHHLFKMNPSLFQDVPQRYLASMLGMSAETFSRIRRKLVS